ncbi:transposase [Streptomyces spiralis]
MQPRRLQPGLLQGAGVDRKRRLDQRRHRPIRAEHRVGGSERRIRTGVPALGKRTSQGGQDAGGLVRRRIDTKTHRSRPFTLPFRMRRSNCPASSRTCSACPDGPCSTRWSLANATHAPSPISPRATWSRRSPPSSRPSLASSRTITPGCCGCCWAPSTISPRRSRNSTGSSSAPWRRSPPQTTAPSAIRPVNVVTARVLAEKLDAVPGIGPATAQIILAEIGADMSRFPTPEHLVSWAKLCPRTIQSGAKNTSGPAGQGNPWLRNRFCWPSWLVGSG